MNDLIFCHDDGVLVKVKNAFLIKEEKDGVYLKLSGGNKHKVKEIHV